jgi:hypothetical protein
MVHRLFDALDSALSAVVPLLYLIGLAAGTLAYFSGLVLEFGSAVGVCLAIAAECHSYLVQRHMRMARARLNRATIRDEAYAQLEAQYIRQRTVLLLLIAFSTFNSIEFVASTWHPSGWLPGWLQILVRGAIVPGPFYLAGELTPLITKPGDVLSHASREMTFAAVRTVSRQWGRRLRRARRRNLDLAPIAVTLLHDAGDVPGAARIRLIAEGLTAAEEGRMPHVRLSPGESSPETRSTVEQLPDPERPPTGPGTPTSRPHLPAKGSNPEQEPLRLPAPRSRSRLSAERKIRAIWAPGMSASELERRAKVSRSPASKWRAILAREAEQAAAH